MAMMMFQSHLSLLFLFLSVIVTPIAVVMADTPDPQQTALAQAQAKALAQAQQEAADSSGSDGTGDGNSLSSSSDEDRKFLRGDILDDEELLEKQKRHQELTHEAIRDDYEKREDNLELICLESMFEADRDKDRALTLQEYRVFEKYYAGQLNYDHPPVEMRGLFDQLKEMGGINPARPDGINVLGCDPIKDRTTVGEERLAVLDKMCKLLEGCLCCGVCEFPNPKNDTSTKNGDGK